MKIIVLGAGAWGTALALSVSDRHQVTLWARNAEQLAALRRDRSNERYLPGQMLPAELRLGGGPSEPIADAIVGQDLIIMATPLSAARSMLHSLKDASVPVAWLSKGFEAPVANTPNARPFGLMVHEILGQVAPNLRAGVLSGPSFALEVARGQPTALVAASDSAEVRDALVSAFHGPNLRVYANDDIIGAEVGGAVKNVLAIATGLCDGLHLGLNARAALITRGLAEMMRLGVALGARAETFTGLSGLGDLVLTATGDLSRNRKVGLQLAEGKTLAQAIESLGHVAEGVYCAHTVVQRARLLGLDMPISEAVVELLEGRVSAHDVVGLLMEREPKSEMV